MEKKKKRKKKKTPLLIVNIDFAKLVYNCIQLILTITTNLSQDRNHVG